MFIEYFGMDAVEEIKKIAIEKLANESQFIVDVLISSRKGPKKVLILLDGDNGITIEDCATLSRELSKTLDDASWMEENYTLEVSTPGLDQPLKLHRQYKKNIGRSLKVKLHEDKIVEGKLTEVFDEKITLTVGSGKKKEVKMIDILFSEIEKTLVIVSFK